MKAIRYHEFGGVEVLKYEDVPEPEISENEVLVHVKAASLNHIDLRLRSGKSPRPVDLPHIGGLDISGDVVKTGKNVTGVAERTRVVIEPAVRCGKCRFCQRGESNLCVAAKVIGVNLYGGFAEYVKVPGANVVPIPDNLSYNDASTIPICSVTAWYGLLERGNLKPGETVLVHAAGSGTGSAAVQVAKLSGAYVIATAGTDEKLAKAKELGADETVNYNKTDFAEEVKKITNKTGVDVIFDQIGASANLGALIMRDISVLGVTVFNAARKDLSSVVNLTSQGKLRPVIDKAFRLEEAAVAQKLLEDRNQFGKVILNP